MTDEQRQAKRPRRTNDADDEVDKGRDDDNDLAALMLLGDNDDDFMTAKARQEAEAERRRQQRRERLRKIVAQEEQGTAATGNGNRNSGSKNTTASSTKNTVVEATRQEASPQQEQSSNHKDGEATENNAESGNESFDMFTSSPPPPPKKSATQKSNNNTNNNRGSQGQHQQDWDDAEGYYNAVIGETIQVVLHNAAVAQPQQSSSTPAAPSSSSLSFRVDGVIGKGVFSTVLKVTTTSNTTSAAIPPTVAIKMIRHNETMAKAAANEIRFLHQLRNARGIIPLLLPIAATSSSSSNNASNSPLTTLEHRGHVLLVFPFVEYNLRDVLQKFGKGVGLSLSAVRSYFGQLISALSHLQKRQIIHADIKPDNILVQGGDGNFLQVYLADFGSAFSATAPENQPTPYLVSRFYRAPEIILGLTPTISIDLWSLAVSIAELFLGNVVFRGKSNNDMLHVFMQHLGVFSSRMVRQHLVQLTKLPTLARQFNKSPDGNFCFLQHTVDSVTGNPIHERLPLVSPSASATSATTSTGRKFPLATPLGPKILRAKSASDSRSEVQQFADLLQKCLALDPTRRISLKEALRHDFFQPGKAAPTK